MKNKIFILLLGSLLSLTTACGGSTPTKHVVDQKLPDGLPSKKKVIKFWHCLGQAKTDNLEKVRDAFNAKYKNYYEVKLDALAGDYSSLSSDVTTKLQAGTVPAMTMGYPDTFADLITNNIEYSAILRLDNFIKDERVEQVKGEDVKLGYDYISDPETGKITALDDFVEAYFKEGTGYQFEGVWSMPMYKSTEVMYYNRSFFSGVNQMNIEKFNAADAETKAQWNSKLAKAKALQSDTILEDLDALKTWVKAHEGYTYDAVHEDGSPLSWQEMTALGKKILAEYKGSKKSSFYPIGYDSDSNLMISQLAQRGYAYTTNDNVKKPEDHYLFGNNANKGNTKTLVDEIIKMIRTDKILKTKNTNGNAYTSDSFKEQECVMSIGSTGGSTYQDSDSFVTGLAPVPAFEDEEGVVQQKYIQQGPSICFFDNKDPYIHKGAWLFYKMMADPENNARLALDNSYDPIRVSSYSTDYYESVISQANQHLGLQYDIPAITSTLKDYYMTSPVFKGSATARNEIGKIITYIIRNKKDSASAIQRAYKACF